VKQKDVAMLLIVIFVAGVFSFVVSKIFFTSSKNRNYSVQVVEPISEEFQQPDKRVFNEQAINPTQLIQIGDSTNPQPF